MDFTVGASLFLIVLATVFLFLPGTLQPFTEGGQEKIVTVNRVADGLVEGALADPEKPHVLNTTCTVALFNGTGPLPGCGYSGSDLNDQVGVTDRQSVNVTLRSNLSSNDEQSDELLCWDDTSGEVKQQGDSGCDDLLAVGDSGAETARSSVTARRVVEFHGRDVYLVVELW